VGENIVKKVLMLATTAAMIEQFNKSNILILENMGYEVHIAGNWIEGNPISNERLEQFKDWVIAHNGKWFHIPATRKPYDLKNNNKSLKIVVSLIRQNQYEFIHCHTPIGSIIGRVAALLTKTKIIYTAHGFHFYKGAPLKNWILYYPAEWICSWITDILITINKEDYERAQKHLHAKRIEYVPGVGIDVEKYANCNVKKNQKLEELGFKSDDFVLISVGELNKNKNHELVIKAIAEIPDKNIKYIICGQGELASEYKTLIKAKNLEDRVKLLGYRTDIVELLSVSDVFVFPSMREGLSVALMEAMASSLPVVASCIRGNTDLIDEGKGGYLVNPNSVHEMILALEKMYENNGCRNRLGSFNLNKIKDYDIKKNGELMSGVYMKIIAGI
jgi:glycosyltransferase involved in cell wall biosynthesis